MIRDNEHDTPPPAAPSPLPFAPFVVDGLAEDGSPRSPTRSVDPPPPAVRELAEACVRFVKAATGVELDYEPETLSVLDHYVAEARRSAVKTREAGVVAAHAAGAYFGEVVRRRYASWWRVEDDDPTEWSIELGSVYLSLRPVSMMADAIFRDEGAGEDEPLIVEERDRAMISARLDDLPAVTEDELFAPTTRLEVIDIAVDAIRSKRIADGEPEANLTPDDYA